MFLVKVLALLSAGVTLTFAAALPREGIAKNGDETQARFFDTYVTNHREPGGLLFGHYDDVDGGGYNDGGYIPYHPSDFGFPLDYAPHGQRILCPPDFIFDGYSDPIETGVCFFESLSYYDDYYD